MSGAKHAYGTEIEVGGTTPASVTSITGPGVSADTIDVTAMDSPNAFKEYIGGLLDGGEVAIEANMIKADFTAILTLLKARAAVACTLTLSGSLGAFTFDAIVTKCEVKGAVTDAVTASYTLKVTGEVTLT